jgi:hypothetical protein
MASVRDLAEMASAAYDDDPNLFHLGWETVRRFQRDRLFAFLFRRPRTNEFVLAIRGSVKPLDFAIDDAQLLLRFFPQLKEAAQEAMLRARTLTGGRGFVCTGHSLGGALSIFLAKTARLPAVTFNALGVSMLFNPGFWDRSDPSRMIHVRAPLDPASLATAPKDGREIVIPVDLPEFEFTLANGVAVLVKQSVAGALGVAAIKNLAMFLILDKKKSQHSMHNLLTAVHRWPELKEDLRW